MGVRFFPVLRAEAVRVRTWPLVAVAGVFEVLSAAGVVPAQASLVHEVALPPLDLTADVGLLVGRAPSPWWFGLGLLLAVAGRATVLALMLGSMRHWGMALRFELVALVPAYIGAELVYDGQATLYSVVLWVGVAVVVVAALILAHLPWRSPRRVAPALVHGLVHGWRGPTVAAYLVVLAVLSELVRAGGGAAAAVGVVVSLIATVAFARRLSRRGAAAAWPSRLAVVAVVVVVAGVVTITKTSSPAPRPPPRAGELVVVSGMDSSSGHGGVFPLRPQLLGFACRQVVYFSYEGTGPGARRGQAACPIRSGAPYRRRDTERPLTELVAAFRAQVDHLRPPVTVVTHSSGGWVVWAAVAGDHATPVRRIVLLAPVEGAHGYPRPGRSGPGAVGAVGMRALTALGRADGFSTFDADLPLPRELLGQAGAADNVFARRLPENVRALAVPAASDAVFFDTSRPFPRAELACPLEVSHGHLAASLAAAAVADRFLAGRAQPTCRPWQSWMADLGWGFKVP